MHQRSALLAFVPVIAMTPFSLLALLVLWLPVSFWIPFWLLVLTFVATGPLLFVRRFQVLVLTPILGARSPTPLSLIHI